MARADGWLEALLSALYDLYRHRGAAGLPAAIARTAGRVITCDSALYLRLEPGLGAFEVVGWPERDFDAVDRELALRLHASDHPLVRHYAQSRDARAWRLYDFVMREAFQRTALYLKLYRPLGIEQQLVMLLPTSEPGITLLAVHRKQADFSDGERETLELLWPHFAQATRTVRALARLRDATALSAVVEGRGIVVLDGGGNIELCTEQARVWLNRYCPEGYPIRKMALPQRVANWVKAQLALSASARGTPSKGRAEPLIVPLGAQFLVIRLVEDHGRDQHLLIMEEELLHAPPAALEGLGLTEREAEVMAWVAQGKTNVEIGIILGMSARTVQKHLEHVFEKLGVESRTAATFRAWQVGRLSALPARQP